DIGKIVIKAIEGVFTLLNDAASWSVQSDVIYSEFRRNGHDVGGPDSIRGLPLDAVDRTVGFLGAKYRAVALLEGGSFGTMGAPGIAIDIPVLIALALRCISEHAVYYGLDVSLPGERAFAMSILGTASSATLAAKQAAMASVSKLGIMLAQKRTWEELERL